MRNRPSNCRGWIDPQIGLRRGQKRGKENQIDHNSRRRKHPQAEERDYCSNLVGADEHDEVEAAETEDPLKTHPGNSLDNSKLLDLKV